MRWQAGGAMVLLGGAAALVLLGGGIWAGFGALAGLNLGAALLLPVGLSGVMWVGQRLAKGVLAQWFWADTRQQLPGLSLSLMALLLALAANVGVGTMVSSFRLTFTGWLDQRLASELYVTARSDAEGSQMVAWLATRADAVLPIFSGEGAVFGKPAELYGMTDHATYRDHWPMLAATPDVWESMAAGEAVLVNEQLARRESVSPGDVVTLQAGTIPGGWQVQVAGVYSDYGNPVAQVILSTDRLLALFPDTPRLRYAVRIAPGRAADLAAGMRAEFDLPPDAVTDQASVKAFSLRVFERTFAVTGALNVLTLGVAGLAMFASLMTLSAMRLPQLAPVWAMGLTRRRLAWLDLLRTMVLALVTLLAALPLGLGLAWVLLAVVNVEAFGWRLPMYVFPADWLRLGLLALLAAGMAAAVPVRRLARLSPGDLLRVFANER